MTIFLILAPYGVLRLADAGDLGHGEPVRRRRVCLAAIAFDVCAAAR